MFIYTISEYICIDGLKKHIGLFTKIDLEIEYQPSLFLEKRNNNKEIIVIFYILFFSYIAFNNDKVKCFRVENRSILV